MAHCVVVDNTPGAVDTRPHGLSEAIDYLPNGRNFGIASALNQGISALLRASFDAAILFDQDSEPPPELLTDLPRLLDGGTQARDGRIALAGPAYDDPRLGGLAPFVRFRPWRLERVAPQGCELIDVDFLISSGSCINLKYWEDIGPMDDDLFIDFVDVEWCVRARRKGYRIVGVPWLRMAHELGGEPVKILGRPYPMHNPVRHYFLFRNVIALMRRSYMPWSWKTTELVKLPVRLVIYSLFPSQRLEHLKLSLQGLCDGWRNRLGPR